MKLTAGKWTILLTFFALSTYTNSDLMKSMNLGGPIPPLLSVGIYALIGLLTIIFLNPSREVLKDVIMWLASSLFVGIITLLSDNQLVITAKSLAPVQAFFASKPQITLWITPIVQLWAYTSIISSTSGSSRHDGGD